jgi:hypothetical protein
MIQTMNHRRPDASPWGRAIAVVLSLLAILPATVRGQVPAGSLSLTLFAGSDELEGSRWARGFAAEIDLARWSSWSVALLGLAARRDFTLGDDELHRNYGVAALGARWTLDRPGPTVALGVGLGVFVADDESETDAGFRSSGNYEELVVPGFEVRWPLNERWGLVFTARDLWTGWWWALIDPEESESKHRLMLSAGVLHR